MNKPLTYGLLLSILMVIAPHAEHLPIWVSSLCAGLLLWRAWLAYTGKPLPKRWLLMLVTFAGTGGIAFEFHTLFGREAGVTLLMLLATLKLMELRKRAMRWCWSTSPASSSSPTFFTRKASPPRYICSPR